MEMLVFNGKLYFLFHFLQCIQRNRNQTWTQRAPGKLAVIKSNSWFYSKTIATTGPRPASPTASKRSEQVKRLFDLTWRWVAHSAVWNLSDAKAEFWDSKSRRSRKNRGQGAAVWVRALTSWLASKEKRLHWAQPLVMFYEAAGDSRSWLSSPLPLVCQAVSRAATKGGFRYRRPVSQWKCRAALSKIAQQAPPPPSHPSFIYNFKKAVWFTGQKLPVPPGDPRRRPRQNKIQRNVSGGESCCNRSEGLGIQIRAKKKRKKDWQRTGEGCKNQWKCRKVMSEDASVKGAGPTRHRWSSSRWNKWGNTPTVHHHEKE